MCDGETRTYTRTTHDFFQFSYCLHIWLRSQTFIKGYILKRLRTVVFSSSMLREVLPYRKWHCSRRPFAATLCNTDLTQDYQLVALKARPVPEWWQWTLPAVSQAEPLQLPLLQTGPACIHQFTPVCASWALSTAHRTNKRMKSSSTNTGMENRKGWAWTGLRLKLKWSDINTCERRCWWSSE